MRLIDHLKSLGLSNRQARGAMSSGKVWVAGIPTRDAAAEIEPRQVQIRENSPRIKVGEDVVILWKDDDMALVWKPPGMLSGPAPGRGNETNVMAEVGAILGTVHVVHFLDEGMSGLMMIARTETAQQALKNQLESNSVEQRYLALTAQGIPDAEMTLDTTFVRNRGDGKRGSVKGAPDGRRAVTHLVGLGRRKGRALIEARLETGLTHQVRIHLAELGCPVLGDGLYGNKSIEQRAPRLALHSSVLGFEHPLTGYAKRFEAPLPADLAAIWRGDRRAPPSKSRRSRGRR